jgi:hypothetical protein
VKPIAFCEIYIEFKNSVSSLQSRCRIYIDTNYNETWETSEPITTTTDGVWSFTDAYESIEAYRYLVPAVFSSAVKVANNSINICHDNRTLAIQYNPLAGRKGDVVIDPFTSLLVWPWAALFEVLWNMVISNVKSSNAPLRHILRHPSVVLKDAYDLLYDPVGSVMPVNLRASERRW